MSLASAYLGVERSFSGKRWEAAETDERLGLALAQRFGLPEIVGRILAARGVDETEVEGFLSPQLRRLLPDPSSFLDMDLAANRLADAIVSDEKIAVFGDYDVDGATSSALLKRFCRAAGAEVEIYIPDRMAEGYGPNLPALLKLKEDGASVVITVDCGIVAFEAIEGAGEAGLDVIVVDHHQAEPQLPAAVAVVNPNRLDDDNPNKHLAAVGVTFLLVVALNRVLRARGWYENGREEPDLLQWLDLVALGTVCDVVQLTGVNRALVTQGLKVMAARGNVGLTALADVARLSEPPAAYHAGFLLGPRVNAGGRVGEAWLGAALLTTDNRNEAEEWAKRLDGYNQERRAIEADCLEAAIAFVEAETDGNFAFAAGPDWHPGVIGIVAGRLRERFDRPACVVAYDGDVGKGSGRSVRGFDLGASIVAARQAGLLIGGGGHEMAAGFTLEREKESAFRAFMAERIGAMEGELVPRYRIDGALQPAGAGTDLLAAIEQLAPFGAGNRQPRFAFPSARIVKAEPVGDNHVRCFLTGESGGRLKAISFRSLDQPLGQALLNSRGLPLHVCGTLRLDRWQGRETPQLTIEDAAEIS
ncbi:MAG: single-stranded-DNA-specific exonuclease RecJ [Rhodospirillaceae bacterium]|nr:single-stranded-DNA-specific exonuclease RecJ [Rhodospirillaceae bacterium]